MWHRLLPEIQFHVALDRPPDVLVVHAGGNDMGLRSSREIVRDIKVDFLRLWSMFPGLVLVWSDMIARKDWRQARSVEKINKARVKLNKEVGRFVRRNGGLVARHLDLEGENGEFLQGDRVHLNDVGNELWFLSLREAIDTAIRVWRDEHR